MESTETHLHSEIIDGEIDIEDYNLIRRDRPGKQGGDCVIYYRKLLKAIHRPDLEDEQVEGICMQVKADSRDILVGTIYRPPNQNSEFFTAFPKLMENIWTKFSNIVLLEDLNTNLLQDERGDTSYEGNKMKGILEQFNMKNVVKGPTRITNHSKTLIDLIVTNRKDLVKQKSTCPLGISDHDMIYANLSASIPRDQPKIITIRNFNKFNERNFQSDIARAPFQVCEVFGDPTDVHYEWNLLFTELCNEHTPLKQIKVRSKQPALDNKGNQNNHESKIQDPEKGVSAKMIHCYGKTIKDLEIQYKQ